MEDIVCRWLIFVGIVVRKPILLIAVFLLVLGSVVPAAFSDYPDDPLTDLSWSGGTAGVDDIKYAFDAGREHENSELGTTVPEITLPSQSVWDGFSDGEKALWLINAERRDRGLAPLTGLESNVGEVAQYYADYLLDNDAWGHYEDGRSPWERLEDNPAIGACHDFLSVAENLAVFVSTGDIPMPIERSVYMWMYDDSGSSWGHRHAILWYPYNDNSGVSGMEGFLGIGRASGGPYQGPFESSWPNAELIVMNVFDPCSSWDDTASAGDKVYVSTGEECGGFTPCYDSIDDGYHHPEAYLEIWVEAGTYLENPVFDREIVVLLRGGWNDDYSAYGGGESVISGALEISAGTVIIDSLTIGGS